jgi:hypothetical protein
LRSRALGGGYADHLQPFGHPRAQKLDEMGRRCPGAEAKPHTGLHELQCLRGGKSFGVVGGERGHGELSGGLPRRVSPLRAAASREGDRDDFEIHLFGAGRTHGSLVVCVGRNIKCESAGVLDLVQSLASPRHFPLAAASFRSISRNANVSIRLSSESKRENAFKLNLSKKRKTFTRSLAGISIFHNKS